MKTITTSTPQQTLKNLISILGDGAEGYKKASENTNDSRLKSLFQTYSIQRIHFMEELETEMQNLGEILENDENTILGTVHRGWIDLKTAFTGKDSQSILKEVERGEEAAKKAFDEALSQDNLPVSLREIINHQASEVYMAYDDIKARREGTDYLV